MKNKNIILGKIDSILGKVFGKGNVVNYDLTTSTGDTLTFAEVTGDAVPKVGDIGMIGDKPAQGEVTVMEENGTSQVYIFDTDNKGELLEIKEPEVPEEEGETVENLKEQVKSLTEKLATVQAKADTLDGVAKEVMSLKRLIVSSGEETEKGAGGKANEEEELTEEEKKDLDTAQVMARLEELKKKKSGSIS